MRRKTNTFKHLDQLHDFSEKDRGHGFILLRKLYVNDPGSAGLTQQHSKSTGPQATLTFRNLSHAKKKKNMKPYINILRCFNCAGLTVAKRRGEHGHLIAGGRLWGTLGTGVSGTAVGG